MNLPVSRALLIAALAWCVQMPIDAAASTEVAGNGAKVDRKASTPRSLSDLPSPTVVVPNTPTPKPSVRAAGSPVPQRMIKLTKTVDVPVVSGGKTIGSMTLKPGMQFKVATETPQTVTVQNGKMLHVLKREWTDIDGTVAPK
jgi:hypothetical protein